MVIAVDFDGTIHDPTARSGNYRMGPPKEGAVTVLKRLVEQGHSIIIFTARNVQRPEAYKAVADWCDYFHVPYHGITNIKQSTFDVMIDDRALHFDNWTQVVHDLTKYQNEMSVKNYKLSAPTQITDITQPL